MEVEGGKGRRGDKSRRGVMRRKKKEQERERE